jgi:hypothetical protein
MQVDRLCIPVLSAYVAVWRAEGDGRKQKLKTGEFGGWSGDVGPYLVAVVCRVWRLPFCFADPLRLTR